MRIVTLAVGVLICAGAFAAVTKASIFGSGVPKNNVVNVRTGDGAIAAARAEAQATLDGFLQRARSPNANQDKFAVKIGVGGTSGPKEFVWLTRFRLDGDVGTGTLDNVPSHTPEFKVGQAVTFRRGEVTDWMYRDGKSLKGNFTGCAILATAPDAAERNKQFLKVGLDCSQPRV
jgi:uncharacterized protein YegJ (DUF2314 family)